MKEEKMNKMKNGSRVWSFIQFFTLFSIMEKLKKWLKMESLEPLFLFAL